MARFHTIHWSAVLEAARRPSPAGDEALAGLCQVQDLTQQVSFRDPVPADCGESRGAKDPSSCPQAGSIWTVASNAKGWGDRVETAQQAEAAKVLRVTQPRVSDLLRGRIDLFSTDASIDMLARLGVGVRLVVKPARAKKVA